MFDSSREFFDKKLYKNPYILKKRSLALTVKIFRTLFIVGLAYLFLFPLFYMLVSAFQSPETIGDPTVIWIPKKLSLDGMKGAIKYLRYWDSLLLTTAFTVFSTLAAVVSCSLVGYGFARFKFPFKNVAFFFVLLTIIVPPQTIMMSQFLHFWHFDFGGILKIFGLEFNLLDTILVYVLPALFAAGLRCGLYIFIFRQFFSGMSVEMEEAAKIDGCGAFKTFYKIMVPLAVPAFTTVILFSVVWHWNDYTYKVYFPSDVKPLSAMLQGMGSALHMMGLSGNSMEMRMYYQSGALLTIFPPLVLYIFAQRYFTESIERTGLVG